MQVTSLHLYPVKSIAAIDTAICEVEREGIVGDRRYMLVDRKGRFISQRQFPIMAMVRARPAPGGFLLSASGQPDLELPATLPDGETLEVSIWNDTVIANQAPPGVNDWFSTAVGVECAVVAMANGYHRPLKPGRGTDGDAVSFADGAPLLLTATASLGDLNDRLPQAVSMTRFRPNVVVETAGPYEEDRWRRIAIGDECEFEVAWSCSRCVLTTVDPERGVRDPDRQPLAMLKAYRDSEEGPLFGQNLIPRRLGRIGVGDVVRVLE